jgi:pimeloyl-ACP methyl ester carboxylesterase
VKRRRLFGWLSLGLLGVIMLSLLALALVPPATGSLASHPHPAASYAEAAARVAALQAQEGAGYNPQCATQFLSHGQKTARAIAFVHGYSNCPQMFAQLGQQFYALGYNVLIVPLPHHGLADRLTDDLTHLTAEELVAYTDQVVDIERGLGDGVTLAGLSAGGVVTGWAAQTRPDLDQAVLIAPSFGLQAIPQPVTVLADNAVLLLPDAFMWWNPLLQAQLGPGYAYPRFSRRGLAQILRLGFAVRGLARRAAPGAASIIVVTNANDNAVDNAVTAQVLADWRAHGSAATAYEFPADLQLPHNLVDPGEPNQHIDRVYPKLVELIAR